MMDCWFVLYNINVRCERQTEQGLMKKADFLRALKVQYTVYVLPIFRIFEKKILASIFCYSQPDSTLSL